MFGSVFYPKGLFGRIKLVYGLFGLFKNTLRPFLWPNCGRFCGLNCDCLWPVQNTILRPVWIKIWFMVVKGLFGLFKNGLWSFLWLVCGRLCELACDSLWNVQKIVFRGY